MSFVDGAQATAGSTEEESTEYTEQPVEQESEDSGELSNPFLQNVAEEDRDIVGKYVKPWDANVTRRFQEVHNQYKPYKDLGEIEQLKQDVEIANFIRNNPDQMYQMLHEQFGQQPQQGQQNQPQQGVTQQQPGNQNLSLNNLPEELQPLAQLMQQQEQQFGTRFQTYDEQFGKMEQTLNVVADYLVQQIDSNAKSMEDKELDTYLSGLKTEFGDFDEDFVLVKMQAGVPGDQAVQQYRKLVQQQVNESRRPDPNVPAVLSGGGGTPSERKDVTQMSEKETRELVANVLARVHQQ